MSALSVNFGSDITALKWAMARAIDLVSAFARRMGEVTGTGYHDSVRPVVG